MGYFPVRYDSRVVNYDPRSFVRLATEVFDNDDDMCTYSLDPSNLLPPLLPILSWAIDQCVINKPTSN